MASTSFFDAPGGLQKEGNSQTLTFKRNTDGTGLVCWSPVPPPGASGCGTPSGHYAGGVLVGSTKPITQAEKPKDGVCCYTGDPTFDSMAFAGDTLGEAKVLWSSNDDKTTSCVVVEGLDEKCSAYYFAFFAIDSTCRYNQDGIYSYSGTLTGPVTECTHSTIAIGLNGARTTDPLPATFDPTQNYPVTFELDGQPLTVLLRGHVMSTYDDVVKELNHAWKTTKPAFTGQFPPGYGQFYYDGKNWFQFDGSKYFPIFPLLSATDPLLFAVGSLWHDTTANTLKEFNGAEWVPVSLPVFQLPFDPTLPPANTIWFNGSTTYTFDGNVWLTVKRYVSETDPAAAFKPTNNTYWKKGDLFFRWNETRNCWRPVKAVIAAGGTGELPNGTLWYNPVDIVLKLWNGLTWVQYPAVYQVDPPVADKETIVWVNPLTQVGRRYNIVSKKWEITPMINAITSPTDPDEGDLLFDPLTVEFFVFDGVKNSWHDISNSLIISDEDPTIPPEIPDGSVWYNPTTTASKVRCGDVWKDAYVIVSSVDPRTLTEGFWYNTTTKLWYERIGNTWNPISPVTRATDPRFPVFGTTWFDGAILRQWTPPGEWTIVDYSTTKIEPQAGQLWLNDDGVLQVWTGSGWTIVEAPYSAAFNKSDCIIITSASCGSCSLIEITDGKFFTSTLRLIINRPIPGNDGISGTPMYKEIGVGSDGSVDERRHVIDNLYMRLGSPTINVELTRQQMDLAVQKGLDYIRRDSGAGYNRGYFFLDLEPGKQHYQLTSKCVGFNTIVDILYLYRPRGSFLNQTFGGGDIYGQQMLQQLYVSGTFDLLSYHLLASYQTVVAKLFATEFQFQWIERTRTLSIMRKIPRRERILVDAVVERTEQDLFTDRMTKNWIENWALSEAKIMLGDMRGKYTALPGAGGTVTLNADTMKAEGVAMQEKLTKELDDYIASDVETWGLGAMIAKG